MSDKRPTPLNTLSARCLLLLIACWAAYPLHGEEETPFTRLFDTGTSSADSLGNDALATRAGWHLVPEDKVDHPFSGDAVLLNDKLAVVLRRRGRDAEVYAKSSSGMKHRATVGKLAMSSLKIEPLAFKISENTSGAVMIEAAPMNDGTAALRYRLTTGEAILEIRPVEATGSVQVLTKARHVVVPDYFGDDMIFGREAFRGLHIPAENFSLNLLDGGDAIVMSVWQSREQDVWLDTASASNEPNLSATHIQCLQGKNIWLAFLESPGIWHAAGGPTLENWKPPFPAKWRCSFARENGVADSWDFEKGPRAEQTAGKHQGPLIVYPIDRSSATPLTATSPTDVMRNTLGVGPCQYILACEGLAAQGDPTPNSVMNWVEKQFEQKKEKKSADDIRERLEVMSEHVSHARTNLQRYAAFAGEMRKFLAGKPGADAFGPIVEDMERFVKSGTASEASPERARQLAAEVSALVGKANALAACQSLGERLRTLGAVQDGALAKCRMAVRRLKQQARTVAANQPPDAGLAQQVQQMAEQQLRNK
ncbi:MAG: hypothetical protein HY301_00105 [Verrucomicrobia bacterium]|nr:hypothetical protein [Verrucomicrobiota bacterium]